MLNDMAYHLIVSILEAFMWDGELAGSENLGEGPGVIVANHMGSIGPVGICASLPMRLYPWVLGDTVDRVKGPETVSKDFVEKILKLKPPVSITIARGLCKISIPLLLSVGCIPVPDSHQEQEMTFKTSINLLKKGKFLLIVPEDTKGEPPDPLTGIRPFKRGFLRVGELYAQEMGKRLPFYPVTVHEAGWVMVGQPIPYNPANAAKLERKRMISLLEGTIKAMHLEITENEVPQSIFFHKRIS
jgi:1-acyl-sn-glycerol-3-phosphate acyltransferase